MTSFVRAMRDLTWRGSTRRRQGFGMPRRSSVGRCCLQSCIQGITCAGKRSTASLLALPGPSGVNHVAGPLGILAHRSSDAAYMTVGGARTCPCRSIPRQSSHLQPRRPSVLASRASVGGGIAAACRSLRTRRPWLASCADPAQGPPSVRAALRRGQRSRRCRRPVRSVGS